MTSIDQKAVPRFSLAEFWDSDIAYSFRRSPVTIGAAALFIAFLLMAVLAPVIAPYNPFNVATLNLMDGFTPPMSTSMTGNYFLLGSDHQGRDVLSSIFFGSRASIFVGITATLLAMAVGVPLGLLAGYCGSTVDAAIMRIAEVQLTFPALLVALLVFGIARGLIAPAQQEAAAVYILICAIGLSHWAQYARTVRGAAMVERQKDYVAAARIMGVHPFWILLRHILPNIIGPVLVISTIGLALAIIEEATLSFLGVGLPPTQPSLGTLIRIGQQYLFSGEWWILFFPAAALVVLSLSVNLLGDWLRDALNPRLR